MQHGLLVQGTVRGLGGALPDLVGPSTNQPLADAEVYFFDNLNSPKSKRMVRTKLTGNFSFVATRIGRSSRGRERQRLLRRATRPFFLDPALKPFDLALNAGSTVKARIIDNEQKPVVGASVRLDQWHNTQILNWQGQTDAEGKFSWASAPEGPLLFSINKSNYFNMRINLAASSGETILTMRKMSAAVGTVVGRGNQAANPGVYDRQRTQLFARRTDSLEPL